LDAIAKHTTEAVALGRMTRGWIVWMHVLLDIARNNGNFAIEYHERVQAMYDLWIKDPTHANPPPMETVAELMTDKTVATTGKVE
jgi:hypothetical protein